MNKVGDSPMELEIAYLPVRIHCPHINFTTPDVEYDIGLTILDLTYLFCQKVALLGWANLRLRAAQISSRSQRTKVDDEKMELKISRMLITGKQSLQ